MLFACVRADAAERDLIVPFVSLRFDAPAAEAEQWCDSLLAAGAQSVDATDANDGTSAETPLYAEPGVDDAAHWRASWRCSRLTALFDADVDVAATLARVADELGEALPAHAIDVVADSDWVRQTQAQFQPTRIDERLWIVPSWCEPVDVNAINLRLDPGLAFGTGSHPTTRLCLLWLLEHLGAGQSVLDYGCGSGILALAAAKLGGAPVTGVDIDPQAVAASRSNASLNGVDAQFRLADEAATAGVSPVDVVVANILANPLRMLAPLLARRVRSGGSIVLSGILAAQASDIVGSYAPWFNMRAWGEDDGWVVLAGSRCGKHG